MKLKFFLGLALVTLTSFSMMGQSVYDFHTDGLNYAKNLVKSKTLNQIVDEFISTTKDYEPISASSYEKLNLILKDRSNIVDYAKDGVGSLRGKVDLNTLSEINSFVTYVEGLTISPSLREEISSRLSSSSSDEAKSGYSLLLSSYEFWSIYDDGDDDGDVAAWIQLDAAGYIIGWVDAVIDDYNSPGGVTPDGQWRRIRKGAGVGLAASIGKWF